MIPLVQIILFLFTLGRAKDSRVFGDNFEHAHSHSAKDLSSFISTNSGSKVNLHVDNVIEAFHSATVENRHFVVTGQDREKSVLTASSNSVRHLFRQTNSTLELHHLWISLTGSSTVLSNVDSSSLFIAETTISTAGTKNLVHACPSQTDGLPSSVSITFSGVHVLTQSSVVPSFVGVRGQTDSTLGATFDVSVIVLSQTLDSVKLTPQDGIFVSSPAPTERWSDFRTSVFSSGCRFTNISSVPNASPEMPRHFRTHYIQIISGMDMTQSEHGLYGLVSSDINSGGDFLFKNTSFSHCTTTFTDEAYVQGQTVPYDTDSTFDTCTFTSMTSTSPGAAIWRQLADTLNLISCTFTECVSTVGSGHHGGGLCAYNCDTVNLEGTNKFDRCVCNGGAGGGFYIYETVTALVVSGVTCEGCSNSDGMDGEGNAYYGNGGGGILGMNKASEAPVQVTNCEFTGCTSTSTGGLTVVSNAEITSCKFEDCEANGRERGGGLNFYNKGTFSLTHSTFTGCSHLTGRGGGVAFPDQSTITMEFVDFTDCHTLDSQGGGCHVGSGANAKIKSCSFTQCTSRDGEGGGCYLGSQGSNEVIDCTFTDCNITKNSFYTGGGGLYSIQSKTLTITNTQFIRCKNLQGPKEISMGGGFYDASGTNIKLHLCTFTECGGGQYGGGASFRGSGSVITNCTFTGCFCKSGGGMDISQGQCTVEDCVFERCSSPNTNGGNGGGGFHVYATTSAVLKHLKFIECVGDGVSGAGLSIDKCNPQLDDVNFTSCQSKAGVSYSFGSGIYSTGDCNPVIKNSNFVSCTSQNQGGGGYLIGTSAKFETCTFQFCEAKGFGAALRIAVVTCEIKGCTIDQCKSTNMDTPIIHYDNAQGTLTITNTHITKSVGTGTQGGAIRVNTKNFQMSYVQIIDSTLNRPTVHYSAQGGAGFIQTVSSGFTDCRFEKCTSAQRAGALFYTNSAGTLTQCTFDTCVAEGGNGGAVEIDATSSVAFVSCIFTACESRSGDGGAVWANVIDNAISFKEDSVEKCSATGSGGGIFISLVSHTTGTVKLENVEFGTETTDLNSCSGSGRNIYVHSNTVPSILNPESLIAAYFTTPKNTDTNIFDPIELESYLFGDKQKNSSSMLYLANPYTGGSLYALVGQFDHELCGNSKLPCGILHRAHNVSKESSVGNKDATVLIQSDFDLTESITSTKAVKWTSSSAQKHTISTGTSTITITSETFTVQSLQFTPTTTLTSPILFTVSGAGSLSVSECTFTGFHSSTSGSVLSATLTTNTVSITSSSFSSCSSSENGGALSIEFGTGSSSSSLTVKASFSECSCGMNKLGSAVFVSGSNLESLIEPSQWSTTGLTHENNSLFWGIDTPLDGKKFHSASLLVYLVGLSAQIISIESSEGKDVIGCGEATTPCQTLSQSMSHLITTSESNTLSIIDSTSLDFELKSTLKHLTLTGTQTSNSNKAVVVTSAGKITANSNALSFSYLDFTTSEQLFDRSLITVTGTGSLSVSECTFTGFHSSTSGSVLSATLTTNTVSITSSSFSSCSSSENGGALSIVFGSGSSSSSVEVDASFSACSCGVGKHGSAVFVSGSNLESLIEPSQWTTTGLTQPANTSLFWGTDDTLSGKFHSATLLVYLVAHSAQIISVEKSEGMDVIGCGEATTPCQTLYQSKSHLTSNQVTNTLSIIDTTTLDFELTSTLKHLTLTGTQTANSNKAVVVTSTGKITANSNALSFSYLDFTTSESSFTRSLMIMSGTAKVTLDSCSFTGFHSSVSGSVLSGSLSDTSSLSITSSTFSSCSSEEDGGVISVSCSTNLPSSSLVIDSSFAPTCACGSGKRGERVFVSGHNFPALIESSFWTASYSGLSSPTNDNLLFGEDLAEYDSSSFNHITLLFYLIPYRSDVIYASLTGRDSNGCGHDSTPCQRMDLGHSHLEGTGNLTLWIVTSARLERSIEFHPNNVLIGSLHGQGKVFVSGESCFVDGDFEADQAPAEAMSLLSTQGSRSA